MIKNKMTNTTIPNNEKEGIDQHTRIVTWRNSKRGKQTEKRNQVQDITVISSD